MGGFVEYDRFDAVGLAQLVRDKQVGATDLLDAAIERVERLNPTINAVCARLYDHGRRAIADGLPAGPFTGVPFLLKDVGALLTGAVSTLGSRFTWEAVTFYRESEAGHRSLPPAWRGHKGGEPLQHQGAPERACRQRRSDYADVKCGVSPGRFASRRAPGRSRHGSGS
jgi:hypothetical protein